MRRLPRIRAGRLAVWLLTLAVALLLSGCAAVGMLPWWYGGIWLALAAVLGACIPEVTRESPDAAFANKPVYRPAFDVSTLVAGDGSQGFIVTDAYAASRTGAAVAVGDLNGDGFADIAVGSPRVSFTYTYRGQVSVLYGHPTFSTPLIDINGVGGTIGKLFFGDAEYDYTGTSVAIVPSVNGDSLPDLVIGSPNNAGSFGKAALLFGANPLPPNGQPLDNAILDGNGGVLLETQYNSNGGGMSVAGGDINGDGIGDIAVGAPEVYFGISTYGAHYELAGTSSPWGSTQDLGTPAPRVNLFNGYTDSYFGRSLAGGADLDGDGYDDLVISARYADTNWRVWARFGDNTSATQIAIGELGAGAGTFRLDNDTANDQAGYSVAMGDVNGDGRADMIVGVTNANRILGSYAYEDDRTGRVHVVFGSPSLRGTSAPGANLNGTNGFTLLGVSRFNFLGSTVGAGDVNGDGINDILVSAYTDPMESPIVYVIFGTTQPRPALCHLSEFTSSHGIILHTFPYGEMSAGGASIRSIAVGDVDGDGHNDIVIGWPNGDNNYGRVFVIFNKALQKE